MDDDIDIEEHDLLDNPKIKSIFPDLSRVKIEIPDEEEDEFEEVYDEETANPTEYDSQSLNYSYEYSFATEELSQENITDYENDSNGYNNQIILGTKKPIDEEILYQEALNSNPIVSLENWEYRLKSSPCYCLTCKTLFSTVNALDAHKMISHSYLVALDTPQKNTARKSTVTSKFCNHCSKTFPDDTSLIKHLYELLPMSNFSKVKTKPSKDFAKVKMEPPKSFTKVKMEPPKGSFSKVKTEPPKSFTKVKIGPPKGDFTKVKMEPKANVEPQFRCIKCKKVFATFNAGRKHKKTVHPTLGHINLIIKIQPKKKKIENSEVKKRNFNFNREGKIFATSSIFPKNTLFQCNTCQISFISCFGAIQHAKMCENSAPFSKCEVCKRKIREKDKEIHALQHSVNDKLKIYTVQSNIYEKVLCKCPKCLACFDELFFWAHYKNCDKAGSAYCPDCDINIAQARYKWHRLKHHQKKFTKKDFIIVEFHDTSLKTQKKQPSTKPTLKVKKHMQQLKMASKKNMQLKKIFVRKGCRSLEDITFFYCQFCECCLYKYSQIGHGRGVCENVRKHFCDFCGLCFRQKSALRHRKLHDKKKFCLKDVKICNLSTGEVISPPHPRMYTCNLKHCKINFLSKRKLKTHKCKIENLQRVICNICNKHFSESAYKVHMHFHSLESLDTAPDSPAIDDIPELMKKYNSINNVWNLLYKCVTCELISKNYDVIVEHSQNHLNGKENDITEICSTCDFKISGNDFPDHANLHLNNEDIDANSFRILTYNYENLFKNTWMDLFGSLPKPHIEQILSKSIYRYTRIVKMRAELLTHSEVSNYFCMKCKSFVEGEDVQQHVLDTCENNDTIACLNCEEVFKSVKQLFSHSCTDFDATNCNLIVFNDDADKVFNKLLFLKSKNVVESVVKTKTQVEKLEKTKTKLKFQKMVSTNTKIRNIDSKTGKSEKIVGKKYKIFKCAKCLCCVMIQANVRRHVCVTKNENKRQKKYCHICKQYFSGNQIGSHLSVFHKNRPHIKNNNLVVVYFNEKKKPKSDKKDALSSIKHDTKVALQTPKKYDLKVPQPLKIKNEPKAPLIKNEQNPKLMLKNQNESSAIIYKCQCGLHFTSIKTISSHLNICSSDLEIASENCSKCQLLFPTELLVTHLCNHHSKSMKLLIENVKKVDLLKCINCSLLFKNYDLLNNHIDDCDVSSGRKCNGCDLNFHRNSYNKHLCSYKDSTTYINKICVVKNVSKVYSVYRCVRCNISYLNHPSYQYHIDVNHKSKIDLVTCEYCSIRFTRNTYPKHILIHKSDHPEYRIKVIDPETGNFVLIKGSNPSSPEDNTDKQTNVRNLNKKEGSAKRKLDMTDENDLIEVENDAKVVKNETKPVKSNTKMKSKKPKDIDKVYKCKKCNISYLFHKSYSYHASVNHKSKIELRVCRHCNLRFTRYTIHNHEKIHKNGNPVYKIKVIDAETGEFEIIEGKNLKKNPVNKEIDNENAVNSVENVEDDNKDLNKSLKRKLEIKIKQEPLDIEDTIVKRPRRSAAERKSYKYTDSEPSSSKSDKVDDDVILTDNSQNSFDDYVRTSYETLSETVKSKILLNKYSNTLFRCTKCEQHSLLKKSFYYHFYNVKCHGAENYKCDICDLQFSKQTLPRHVYVHHEKMGLKKDDFNICTEEVFKTWNLDGKVKHVDDSSQHDDSIEMIDLSQVSNETLSEEQREKVDSDLVDNVDQVVSLDESDANLAEVDTNLNELNNIDQVDKLVSRDKSDTNLPEVNNIDEVDTNLTEADNIDEVDKLVTNDEPDITDKIVYYKCSDCNVCFLNAKSCFNHTFRHEILDSKTYIQCKICDFQFLIDSLKDHMDLHHTNDFNIKNLTIEEYKPQELEKPPKIEIYKALDKLQFGTVSTTTDMGAV